MSEPRAARAALGPNPGPLPDLEPPQLDILEKQKLLSTWSGYWETCWVESLQYLRGAMQHERALRDGESKNPVLQRAEMTVDAEKATMLEYLPNVVDRVIGFLEGAATNVRKALPMLEQQDRERMKQKVDDALLYVRTVKEATEERHLFSQLINYQFRRNAALGAPKKLKEIDEEIRRIDDQMVAAAGKKKDELEKRKRQLQEDRKEVVKPEDPQSLDDRSQEILARLGNEPDFRGITLASTSQSWVAHTLWVEQNILRNAKIAKLPKDEVDALQIKVDGYTRMYFREAEELLKRQALQLTQRMEAVKKQEEEKPAPWKQRLLKDEQQALQRRILDLQQEGVALEKWKKSEKFKEVPFDAAFHHFHTLDQRILNVLAGEGDVRNKLPSHFWPHDLPLAVAMERYDQLRTAGITVASNPTLSTPPERAEKILGPINAERTTQVNHTLRLLEELVRHQSDMEEMMLTQKHFGLSKNLHGARDPSEEKTVPEVLAEHRRFVEDQRTFHARRLGRMLEATREVADPNNWKEMYDKLYLEYGRGLESGSKLFSDFIRGLSGVTGLNAVGMDTFFDKMLPTSLHDVFKEVIGKELADIKKDPIELQKLRREVRAALLVRGVSAETREEWRKELGVQALPGKPGAQGVVDFVKGKVAEFVGFDLEALVLRLSEREDLLNKGVLKDEEVTDEQMKERLLQRKLASTRDVVQKFASSQEVTRLEETQAVLDRVPPPNLFAAGTVDTKAVEAGKRVTKEEVDALLARRDTLATAVLAEVKGKPEMLKRLNEVCAIRLGIDAKNVTDKQRLEEVKGAGEYWSESKEVAAFRNDGATLIERCKRQMEQDIGTLGPEGGQGTGFVGVYQELLDTMEKTVDRRLQLKPQAIAVGRGWGRWSYISFSTGVAVPVVGLGGGTLLWGGSKIARAAWSMVRPPPAEAAGGGMLWKGMAIAQLARTGTDVYEWTQIRERFDEERMRMATVLATSGFTPEDGKPLHEATSFRYVDVDPDTKKESVITIKLNPYLDAARIAEDGQGMRIAGDMLQYLGLKVGQTARLGMRSSPLYSLVFSGVELQVADVKVSAKARLLAKIPPEFHPYLDPSVTGNTPFELLAQFSNDPPGDNRTTAYHGLEHNYRDVRSSTWLSLLENEMRHFPALRDEVMPAPGVLGVREFAEKDLREIFMPLVAVRLRKHLGTIAPPVEQLLDGKITTTQWALLVQTTGPENVLRALREASILFTQHTRERRLRQAIGIRRQHVKEMSDFYQKNIAGLRPPFPPEIAEEFKRMEKMQAALDALIDGLKTQKVFGTSLGDLPSVQDALQAPLTKEVPQGTTVEAMLKHFDLQYERREVFNPNPPRARRAVEKYVVEKGVLTDFPEGIDLDDTARIYDFVDDVVLRKELQTALHYSTTTGWIPTLKEAEQSRVVEGVKPAFLYQGGYGVPLLGIPDQKEDIPEAEFASLKSTLKQLSSMLKVEYVEPKNAMDARMAVTDGVVHVFALKRLAAQETLKTQKKDEQKDPLAVYFPPKTGRIAQLPGARVYRADGGGDLVLPDMSAIAELARREGPEFAPDKVLAMFREGEGDARLYTLIYGEPGNVRQWRVVQIGDIASAKGQPIQGSWLLSSAQEFAARQPHGAIMLERVARDTVSDAKGDLLVAVGAAVMPFPEGIVDKQQLVTEGLQIVKGNLDAKGMKIMEQNLEILKKAKSVEFHRIGTGLTCGLLPGSEDTLVLRMIDPVKTERHSLVTPHSAPTKEGIAAPPTSSRFAYFTWKSGEAVLRPQKMLGTLLPLMENPPRQVKVGEGAALPTEEEKKRLRSVLVMPIAGERQATAAAQSLKDIINLSNTDVRKEGKTWQLASQALYDTLRPIYVALPGPNAQRAFHDALLQEIFAADATLVFPGSPRIKNAKGVSIDDIAKKMIQRIGKPEFPKN